MSNKKFQPIAIGINESAKSEHERNLNAKRSDLRELSDYASRFVDVNDYSLLFTDFKKTFRDLFKDKFASQFPNLVSQAKQLEMVDCDITKIDALCEAIESNPITLNSDLKYTEKTDFNIYTKDEEQNKLFITLSRIGEDYSELKKNGLNVFPMAIVNGTNQALRYDFATQRLKPNITIFTSKWSRR